METEQPFKLLRSPGHKALLLAGPRLKPLQQVHANIIISGSGRNRALLTKLLTLACAAGSITYTRRIFLATPDPDSFLYNSAIKCSSKFHFSLDSVIFYRKMLVSQISPSNYTFTAVIKACADVSAMYLGNGIHTHALVCGYGLDQYVQAALVVFYARCGVLGVARKLFDKMPERNVVAWNSMISGYEQNGVANEAIILFEQMQEMGIEPDSATFVSLLSACAQMGSLSLGCWVHEYVIKNGFYLSVMLGSSLINMYARCGNVSRAREVLDSMSERNVVAWTAMISGYGINGYGKEALEIFGQMNPCPNRITFVAVLSACAHAGLVDEGRRLFASMSHEYGLIPGAEHNVCIVDMLGRAGHLYEAYEFINQLGSRNSHPAIWTAMLGACKMHKNFNLGVEIAERLVSLEPENPGHYVMLSNIYASVGRMDRVEKVRNIMIRKRLNKQVGYSTIEVYKKTYLFKTGDKVHSETDEIYRYLDKLMWRCREIGYVVVEDTVMHQVEEEEIEYALRYHSEKLAIAFGLMKSSGSSSGIRIVKNLRMCNDCHSAIKFISIVANREIVVRDKLRFHHFKDGSCSCLDYW